MELQLAPKVVPLRMTAAEVRQALKRYYPHPQYGLVFEVAKSTGFEANRHLDAMAMSLWPSRGLHVYGIEIKVSYGDWKRELATPQKAEELAQFCDYFYIAAPRGVVPVHEIPANWGLIEVRETKTVEAKAPARLEPQQVSRNQLAAIFRAASRGPDPEMADVAISERKAKLEEGFEDRLKQELELRKASNDIEAQSWRKLCEALGENPNRWTDDDNIIATIKAIKKAGLFGGHNSLRDLQHDTERMAGKLKAVLDEFGIERKADAA